MTSEQIALLNFKISNLTEAIEHNNQRLCAMYSTGKWTREYQDVILDNMRRLKERRNEYQGEMAKLVRVENITIQIP